MADADQEKNGSSQSDVRDRLAVGTTLGERYCIREVIGEGAMGTVYAAEHLLLKKRVAIKVLHPDLLKIPNIAARFEREAQAMARIDHPNVTCALDFGRLGSGAMYLVLEFVEGRRLREELARGPLSLARVLGIAKQLAEALVAAQDLGIVHRDLKPENVVLAQRGAESDFVKVLDFGIARMASFEEESGSNQPLTKLGAVFGTPEYMAPEQAMGQRVDTRADLYSLGVILFEMLTGVRPYVQTGQTGILSLQLTSPRPTLAERAPGIRVPEEVERLVYRLLAKGAQDRFQRASDVVAALDAIAAAAEVEKPKSSVPPANLSEPLPSFPLTTCLHGLAPQLQQSEGAAGGGSPSLLSSHRLARMREAFHSAGEVLGLLGDKLIDAGAARLPARHRERLIRVPRGVSRGALAFLGFVLLFLPIGIVGLAVRCSSGAADATSVASAAPSVSASASAVVEPSSPPPVVLDEKSKDPDVLIELALARLRADREAESVGFVLRALGYQPERRNDERVATVLFRTANSVQKETADKSFAVLQGVMAAKGAEVLYQLWIDRGVREMTRKRVDKWIRSEQFERAASGATAVAAKLRAADSCTRKAVLLPMAGKIGGAAALSYLKELEQLKGCGLGGADDCYPCLRTDHQLKDAILQIQSRLETRR